MRGVKSRGLKASKIAPPCSADSISIGPKMHQLRKLNLDRLVHQMSAHGRYDL